MDSRFVIILGMAHSGTTILAKTLCQCPDVYPIVTGKESELYENQELQSRTRGDANYLKEIAARREEKWMLLKRPWAENDPAFFGREFQNARYVICLKNPEDIYHSWSKETALVNNYLQKSRTEQIWTYGRWLLHATAFQWYSNCKNTRILHYDLILNHASHVFSMLSEWLDLGFSFDVSEIQKDVDSKRKLIAESYIKESQCESA